MRDIPGYPAGADSVEPVVRVVHKGFDREVGTLALSRELPSSFHAQVLGLGGLTQATGTVDWSPTSDLVESHPTAFNRLGGWPPKTRDAVEVYTGVRTTAGELLARQLTGSISQSNGDPLEGVQSGLVDRIARLSRKITLPPLLNTMPPLGDGGDWRGVGLHPTYFTDLAARSGSFCSTPPMSENCAFSVPLMGSAWPERGVLTAGVRFTERSNANLQWRETTWGMGLADAALTYYASGNTSLTRPMEVTLMCGVSEAEVSVGVMWGGVGLRLVCDSRNAVAWLDTPGGSTRITSLGGPPSPATMRVSPQGGSLLVEIRDAAGAMASGSVGRPAEINGNASHVQVNSKGYNAIIGGVQVSFPSSAWTAVGFRRNAFITPAANSTSLRASPPIMARTAKNLLEEQSDAELAALWIDGDGSLHWTNRNRLINGGSVMTLTSQHHLKSLPWEEDFAGVSSTVEVVSRKPTVQQSKQPSLPMWDSGMSSTDPGDTFEWLIHPEADMDWIMPDTDIVSLHQRYNASGFHKFSRGIGSWIALWAERDDGLVSSFEAGAYASCSFVDHRTYRVAATIVGYSSDNHLFDFTLKIPTPDPKDSTTNAGPARYQPGLSLPVIRGKGLTMWEDVTYTAEAGLWDSPVLTHDVGWWVQDPAACQAIADLLAANTNAPRPTLSGVSVVPDARLQLGDVVILSDPDITGVQFRCLVVGIEDRFTSGPTTWEQSCNFRVLGYSTIATSLGDLDTAWARELLSTLDAARAGEALAQFDSNPLKGAPQ